MALRFNLKYRAAGFDGVTSLNFATALGAAEAGLTAIDSGATDIVLTDREAPPVPSPQDTEREAFLAEQQEYYWLDRPDDYNVFEEQQIFLDNEGGW